jgi:polyhydroxyalkanoate synthesis repressor PhaR
MSEMRIIKKYPNRRLYDSVESRYITLLDLRRLVVDRIEFKVVEKSSERDITSSVLLQVVAGQEHGAGALLGRDFLLQLIRSYGGAMGSKVRGYLEESLKLFVGQQPVTGMAGHGSSHRESALEVAKPGRGARR